MLLDMDEFAILCSRLLARSTGFTSGELGRLLAHWGYEERQPETEGSGQIVFFHPKTLHVVRLSGPGDAGRLRSYQLDQIVEELTEQGLLP